LSTIFRLKKVSLYEQTNFLPLFQEDFYSFYMLTLFAHIYDFSLLHSPQMTQPPGAGGILQRAAACQKEDFFPASAWTPAGARIKREYLKRE
jgi:hypothetical protein